MDKPTAEAAFSLKRTSDGAPVSGSFGWYGNALIFKSQRRPGARDAVHGERLDRRQGPRRQPAGGREELAVHDDQPAERLQRLPGRRRDRCLPNSVYAIFNRAMDKPTAEAAFSLKRTSDGAAVSGSFGWYGNALIFDPNADLAPGTQYTVSVSTAAKDLAGNPLAAAKSWQFTTTNPPSVSSVYPADGATGVSPNSVTRSSTGRWTSPRPRPPSR